MPQLGSGHLYRISGVKEKVEFWEEVKNNLWALLILIMQMWKNIR